jgi:hypothetical protein
MIDLTHKGLIRGGGSGEERSGDDRWRSSDGAAAAARILGKCRRGKAITCAWGLEWVLGKS